MPLSPETPQDPDDCRIPDHDESTEKKVDLGKQKSDEKTAENFIDDTEVSKRGENDFIKRKRDENSNENSMDESVDLTKKKKRVSVPTLNEVFERFPKLRTEIAENLDNESIISLKTVSRQMNQVLEEDRSFWMRRIKKFPLEVDKSKCSNVEKKKKAKLRSHLNRSVTGIVIPDNDIKTHFCLWCQKGHAQIWRHYITIHRDQPQIEELLNHQKKSPQRNHILRKLQREGDYENNMRTIAAKKGYFVVHWLADWAFESLL